MRLFVAAFLPDKVIKEALDIQNLIKNNTHIKAKYTQKENLHITLAFIGDTNPQKISNIIDKLNQIKNNQANASINNIGLSKRYETMLWLRVIGEPLIDVANNIQKALLDYIKNKNKPFLGHITLARIKDHDFNLEKLEYFIKNTKIEKLNWTITEFYLVESKLYPEGPRYNKIKKFNLT